MKEHAWSYQTYEGKENQELLQNFKGERDGYIQVGPKKYFFPKRFAKDGPLFYNFKPRPTDTWVVTFPRSGTTWTQELVWVLGNNFDFDTAAKIPLAERFPFLEFSACMNEDFLQDIKDGRDGQTKKEIEEITGEVMTKLENTNEPRFIKSHLPFTLLHPELLSCGAKVVYVARNPKDVALSYYHLHRLFKTLDYTGNFADFWDHFENDRLLWCPYWDHLKEAWDLRHSSNLLFLFYEDLQQNMNKTIHRIGNFLEKNVTDENAKDLAEHLDIKNFRKNPSVNFENLLQYGIINDRKMGFVRNGGEKTTTEYTTELLKRVDGWMLKNLRDTTLTFP